jgi:Tfp pilus assembly protein PilF
LEKSVPYYERAVMLKPLYLDFQNKLGEAYLDINQIEKAKKVFQFIVNENPKYANAQASLGYIFMEEKNWINATKHLQEAIRLDPNLSQSMLNLAVVYYQTNQNKFIKPLLKHVLLLDATNEQAKAMLVEIESL